MVVIDLLAQDLANASLHRLHAMTSFGGQSHRTPPRTTSCSRLSSNEKLPPHANAVQRHSEKSKRVTSIISHLRHAADSSGKVDGIS
jgi:hypothetical protein